MESSGTGLSEHVRIIFGGSAVSYMAKRRSSGEGSLFYSRSEQCWIAEILLPDGKKKRKRSKKQYVAREWLRTSIAEIKNGTFVANDQMTVKQLFDRFLGDIVDKNLKPKTADSYRYIITKHILPSLGNVKLKELKPTHIQAVYTTKLEEGLSKRTVQYIHAVLRRALNQAVQWELLARNPTDRVAPPTPDKRAPETLTVEQIKKFLEVVRDHRYYPIYLIAIGCGLREGEILGLEAKDIDLENGQISVRQTVVYIRGKILINDPKTPSAMRVVAMPAFVAQTLKNIPMPKEGLLFRTSRNTPISPRNLLRHFHESLAKARIPRVKFHSLRHSYASLQLLSGTHPKVVQEALGHSSIELTLNTYSHLLPGLQKEAAEKIDKIFATP